MTIKFYTYKIEDYTNDSEDYIHIWGLDKNMDDVLIRVSGFRYSVMLPIPSTIQSYDIQNFTNEIVNQLKQYVENRATIRSLYNYKIGRQSRFLILYLKRYRMRYNMSRKTLKYRHYNMNIHNDVSYPAHLQLMSDYNLSYGDWHSCPYYLSNNFISRSKFEIVCDYRDVKIISEDDPIRSVSIKPTIMSYDIECVSHDDTFPNPNKLQDEIFLITASVSTSRPSGINGNFAFSRFSCNQPVDSHVIKCESEEDLLQQFQKFIIKSNPDVIIGYNIDSFDGPYITQRLYNIGLEWDNVGKLIDYPVTTYRPNRIPDIGTSSKFLNRNKRDAGKEYIPMSGRVHIDLYRHISENYKMRSYSLDNVSNYFLNEGKHDISVKEMFQSVKNHPDITESEDYRSVYDSVVEYGLQDSALVLRLETKLVIFFGLSMMARVMSTNIDEFYTRGSSHKVKNMLYRRCRERNILIKDSVTDQAGGYQGALVLEPKTGLHKYVYTLDLDSLYPNIVRSYNICYTTFLHDDTLHNDYYDLEFEDNGMLCQYKFRKDFIGVIPEICASLIERRTEVRKRRSDDPVITLVNDKLQLALKIAANSIYGVLGLTSSPLSFIEGARSVTAMGRIIIGKIVDKLTDKGHDVLYGDTDSVMAKVPGIKNDQEIYSIAEDTMKYLNVWLKSIGGNLGLKLEKTGTIFLIKKKKYIYHYWDNKTGEMETGKDGNYIYHTTGAESVRRDKCIYQIKFFDRVSDLIMKSTEKRKLYDFIFDTGLDFLRRYDKIEDKPVDQQELLISYTMNDYYKSDSYFLGLLMKRLKSDNYDVKIGQREDIIITTRGDSLSKLGDKMYTAREYKEYHDDQNPYSDNTCLSLHNKGLHPDYFYYLNKRIRNAVDNLFSIAYPAEDIEEIRKDYILNILDEYHDHPVLSDYTAGRMDMDKKELSELVTKVISKEKQKRYVGDKRLSLLIFRLRLLRRRYTDFSVTTPCKQLTKTVEYRMAVLSELLNMNKDYESEEDIYDDDYYS